MRNHNSIPEFRMLEEGDQSAHVQLKIDQFFANDFITPPMTQPIQSVDFMALSNKRREYLHRQQKKKISALDNIPETRSSKKRNQPTFLHI